MIHEYWATFLELLEEPFKHLGMIWGIVPLYFAWWLNEITSSKASYRTALQTGFSFLWAGAQWLYPYAAGPGSVRAWTGVHSPPAINLAVTLLVLALGAVAFVSGIRHSFPRYGSFLGHTRFCNYFMIAIYPIQAHYLTWTWERLIAIGLFAVPAWLALHVGLMPIRNRK